LKEERLDLCLVRLGFAPSRRTARALISADRVRVNGRRLRKGEAVAPGDNIEIAGLPLPAGLAPNPNLKIGVLFEDSAILVVDKPGRIPCHPLRAEERGTVMNAAAAAYPETAAAGDKPLEGGLVHRLDNGTSGALIIARTHEAFNALRDAIRHGHIVRVYHALVTGVLDHPIEIATPIAHHPKNPRKMVTTAARGVATGMGGDILAGARPAATMVEPIERLRGFTLVAVRPRTGCRHQIRVHLASVGLPLAGDALYGAPPLAGLAPGRFWLHLAALELDSPASGHIRVESPLPADLRDALMGLR
jgi:23S rRNA pseudouridine1911/1915/1917 synthase